MYTNNDWRMYELYHHGVDGQRWGVRNGPPYPLSSLLSTGKALTARARNTVKGAVDTTVRKSKKAIKDYQVKREKERIEKNRLEEEEKARKLQSKKDEAIKSGEYEKVKALERHFTAQEFREAVERCELNKRLENTKPQKISAFDKTLNLVNKGSQALGSGINAWNKFALIYNSLNDDPLPIINGKDFETQKNERRRAAENARPKENSSQNRSESSKSSKTTNRRSDFYSNQPRYSQNQLLLTTGKRGK